MNNYPLIDIIFPHKGSLESLVSTLLKWASFFSPCDSSLSRILIVTDAATISEKDLLVPLFPHAFFCKLYFIEDIRSAGVYPAWNQALPYLLGHYVFITGSNDGPSSGTTILDIQYDVRRFSKYSNEYCIVYNEERFLPPVNITQSHQNSDSNLPAFFAFLLRLFASCAHPKAFKLRRILMFFATIRGLPIHMQSTLFPSFYFSEYLFDESLSIASDYKFWCSIVLDVDTFFSRKSSFSFDLSGVSVGRRKDMISETYSISKQYFGPLSLITLLWLNVSSLKKYFS